MKRGLLVKNMITRFPINTIEWLRNSYEEWDVAAFYEESTYKQFKSDIKKVTKAKPVLVDHHEAHAMSSILMTDWKDCAVMVIDTVGSKFSTSLGVYENDKITWIKRFRYPNSLGLFIQLLLVYWVLSHSAVSLKSWLRQDTVLLNGLNL